MFFETIKALSKNGWEENKVELDFICRLNVMDWDQMLRDIATVSKLRAVFLKKRLTPEYSLIECKKYLENLIGE